MFRYFRNNNILKNYKNSLKNYNSKRSYYNNYNKSSDTIIYGLLGSNLIIFLTWNYADNTYNRELLRQLRRHFTVSAPGVFRDYNVHTLITSCFSHYEFSHFLINMITLYSFSSVPLMLLSSRQFLFLYFGGGLVSSLTQILSPLIMPKSWPARRTLNYNTVGLGASGAINSLVAWHILYSPTAKVYLYGILPMPLALFGLGFIGMDAYSLYYGDTGVGNAAHLSGAAFGALFYLITRRRLPSSWRR